MLQIAPCHGRIAEDGLLTLELRQLTQATLRLVRSSLCGDADDAASTDGGVGAIAHTVVSISLA